MAGWALLAVPGSTLTGHTGTAWAARSAPPGNPFTLGVASGESTSDGMVLWTRLAPTPLADDGLGGMGERTTTVEWELAADEGFGQVVRRGVETTGPELGHSVHVELVGLKPGREYFYRSGPEIETLANYRQRHAQYKTDADLQAAHAVAPWLVVWDDHELDNNWADEVHENPETPQPNFLARRAAALRAYWENMPLRAAQRPQGIDMQLYRRVSWGRMATFHMLDTRQYRSDQPCGDDFNTDCAERSDPARSLPGSEQERWIADGFRASRARWDVLGQQVFFAQVDFTPGPGRGFNPDSWDGAPRSRDRVVDSWVAAKARNVVVLTGDVHAHWAADVKHRFDDPASPVVGTELVSSSITSGGDGSETRPDTAAYLADNPHIRFYNNRRGYVRTRFTPNEMTADFQVLPYVKQAGAPVETRATFVVEDRRPGLHPA